MSEIFGGNFGEKEQPKQPDQLNQPEKLSNELEEYAAAMMDYLGIDAQKEQKEPVEKLECQQYVKEFQAMVEPLLEESLLKRLNSITSEEEASESQERISVKEVLVEIVRKKNFIKDKTNITEQDYAEVQATY